MKAGSELARVRNLKAVYLERAKKAEAELATLKAAIENEIAVIDADERFHYKPAMVQINAPLALIQVHLEARMELAQRLLAAGDTKPATTNGALLKWLGYICKAAIMGAAASGYKWRLEDDRMKEAVRALIASAPSAKGAPAPAPGKE